jgi:hypothetical protein
LDSTQIVLPGLLLYPINVISKYEWLIAHISLAKNMKSKGTIIKLRKKQTEEAQQRPNRDSHASLLTCTKKEEDPSIFAVCDPPPLNFQ